MKRNDISYRIYINSTPLEDLTQSERTAVAERCAERMGTVLNEHFSQHTEEYERMCEIEQSGSML